MAAAPPTQKDLVRPAQDEPKMTVVYERNVEREVRTSSLAYVCSLNFRLIDYDLWRGRMPACIAD